jgi:hypothetical protein
LIRKITSRGLLALFLCLAGTVRADLPGGVTLWQGKRPLDFMVVGVHAESGKYFLLPEMMAGGPEALAGELYGLNLELTFGALFRTLRPSRLYVGIPDPRTVPESHGREKIFFMRYLSRHCGWTPAQCGHVRFFKVPYEVLYARDACKVLGHDSRGRTVLFSGPADHPVYAAFTNALSRAFPSDFAPYTGLAGTSAEGGDEKILTMPDGRLGVLVGHHRFLHYFGRDSPNLGSADGLSDAQIEEARQAFSQALFGLPVHALPEAALKDPGLANPEVYHLDMQVTLARHEGRYDAFVPECESGAVDRISGQPLDPGFRAQVDQQYDQVALELEGLGFQVNRIPFWDHPVRAPVNMLKVDEAGRTVLLVSKYPYHLPAGDPGTAQGHFNGLMSDLTKGFDGLSPAKALQAAWKGLKEVEEAPSPPFDQERKILEGRGYAVKAIPMFPGGGGGLHCLVLR